MLLDAPPPLGHVALRSVYFEHDGPRLFSVTRPSDDVSYMAICVDETTSTILFIYWAVSEDELKSIERGELPLRESLLRSEDVILATEDYSNDEPGVSIRTLSRDELLDEYLPDSGALLTDLRAPAARAAEGREPLPVRDPVGEVRSYVPIKPADTPHRFLNSFSIDRLNQAATDDRHLYAAVEVQSDAQRLDAEAALNLRSLSSISGAVQELIFALGNESQGFARTGETVRSALDMSVHGAMAASFVLVLRTPEQGMLFDGEVSVRALRGLTWILKSSRVATDLITELEGRSYQVRKRVRELLTSVTEAEAGLTAVVTDGEIVTWGRVTADQAAEALSAIVAVPPSRSTLQLNGVMLTALNLTRRTFEVWDRATGKKYSGSLDESLLGQVDGLAVSQSEVLYRVVLDVETDFAQDRVGPARRNRLVSISIA